MSWVHHNRNIMSSLQNSSIYTISAPKAKASNNIASLYQTHSAIGPSWICLNTPTTWINLSACATPSLYSYCTHTQGYMLLENTPSNTTHRSINLCSNSSSSTYAHTKTHSTWETHNIETQVAPTNINSSHAHR